MERLTIKELAPYLPYGLKGRVDKETYLQEENERIGELKTIDLADHNYDLAVYGELGYFLCDISDFKPHLRPLSSLTEEIEHDGERFVPIIELFKLRTQVTGDKIADYYIENDTAILKLDAQHLDDYEFRAFFEIDIEPNGVMFSIATETWKDVVMIREDVNLCGNEMTMFEKLHEWHFDTGNLIGRNLALPIEGKEVENVD